MLGTTRVRGEFTSGTNFLRGEFTSGAKDCFGGVLKLGATLLLLESLTTSWMLCSSFDSSTVGDLYRRLIRKTVSRGWSSN